MPELFWSDLLMAEGRNLLNFLISMAVVMFSICFLFSWPVYDNIVKDEYPNNYLKGKICTLTKISPEKDLKNAHKSKVIVIAMGFNFLYSFLSAIFEF